MEKSYTEYIIINSADMQSLQDKVNAMSKEGYMLYHSYGVQNFTGALHVVWMSKYIEANKTGE